jgi:hypothetical protein
MIGMLPMKGAIPVKISESTKTLWESTYGDVVNSDHSIECKFCGNSLIGVGPNIQIVCLECFAKTQEAMDRLSKLDEELGL